MASPIVTARWQHLILANYAVDPGLIDHLVPAGTRLDAWNNATLMSLVAFQFHDTRLFGMPVPGHRHFDEVNLRFYVRRDTAGESRRGVVFVKEIVPKLGVALGARLLYGEPYATMPVRGVLNMEGVERGEAGHLYYGWGPFGRRMALSASIGGPPSVPALGSLEQFITEHHWGYNGGKHRRTTEYRVDHPSWRVWQARSVSLEGDPTDIYGPYIGKALRQAPHSAFVADGSNVAVFRGARI